jgi:pyruvate ferredoxin oxidoreductase delta subunit
MSETKLPGWKNIPLGCAILEPLSARRNLTGSWRSQRPIWEHEKCVQCGVCELFCPEACISQNADGYFEADMDYCKGCGICARECWTQCIHMKQEEM